MLLLLQFIVVMEMTSSDTGKGMFGEELIGNVETEEVTFQKHELLPPRFSDETHHDNLRRRKRLVEGRLVEGRRKNERDEVFLDNDDEEQLLPYGHPERTDGLLKNTNCDWMIPVDDCIGHCNILSPGLSSQVCTYLFVSFDESRVELRLPGTNLMRENESCMWTMEVYDGITSSDLFVGRFCAFQEAEAQPMHFISRASSMVLRFLPNRVLTHSNSAHFQAMEKWKYHPEQAEVVGSTQCDWLFRSSKSTSGDLHTPDFYLNEATTCHYKFLCDSETDAREIQIILQVNIFFRYKKHDGESCNETLTLTDGTEEVERFCISEVVEDVHHRYHFVHNSTFHWATVTFERITKQLSNPEPTWINYKFRRKDKQTRFSQISFTSTIRTPNSANEILRPPTCLHASAIFLIISKFQTKTILLTF